MHKISQSSHAMYRHLSSCGVRMELETLKSNWEVVFGFCQTKCVCVCWLGDWLFTYFNTHVPYLIISQCHLKRTCLFHGHWVLPIITDGAARREGYKSVSLLPLKIFRGFPQNMPPVDWHQIQIIVHKSFYLVGEDLPSLVFNEDLKKTLSQL